MCSGASLNHIYRSVWNASLGAMVAVAEISPACSGSGRAGGTVVGVRTASSVMALSGLRALAAALAVAFSSVPWVAHANPAGGVAIVGQASMATSGNQLTVTTQNGAGANHSAINWQSFSIPQGNSTYFQQPNAASTVINRVVTNTPSQIFGTLGSNGSLLLVNQSGITVGAGAVVDTAGFTASALRMSDADVLAGRLRFGDDAGSDTGVSVFGNILARSGDVVLLGSQVSTGQDALIQAPNGSTILAAGQQIEITARGLEGITLQVQAPTDQAVNLGTLQAGAVGMFAGTLRHSGQIKANTISQEGGKVVLKAADQLVVDGRVHAQGQDGQGGVVHATADKVMLNSGADIDVSGASGGGEALIGGGWQGHDTRISNAQKTVVATGAKISADATERGNGGTVVVWADGTTGFGGAVSARGGALGGDGGQAEVSGKQYLDFFGAADLTASLGRNGSLLLDPASITIGTLAAIDGYGGDVTAAGIASGDYFGVSSFITATQVSTLLNSANLSLSATGDIDVAAVIAKTLGTATTLTLNSTSGHVYLNASIGGTPSSPLNLSLFGNAGVLQRSGAIIAPSLIATASGDYANVALVGGVNTVGTSSFNAGNMALGYGGSVSFKNGVALALGNVTAATLNVDTSAGNGAITQLGGSTIALGSSGATFATGSGNVTLNNAGNVIPGLRVNGAGAVSVTAGGANGLSVFDVNAGSLTLRATGRIDSLSDVVTTGAVDIRSTGGVIDFCADGCGNISAGGKIKMQAAGSLLFGGTMLSSAPGDAIALIAGSSMNLSGYGGSITTPAGRSLAYVNYGLTHNFSLLAPAFKQYNYTVGATVLGSGDGVIYANATPATLNSSLTGTVTKVYDASLGITLSGSAFGTISSGAIDGDVVTGVSLSGGTGMLDNKDVGTAKQVTATSMTVSGVSGGNGISTVYGYLTKASGNIGTVTPKSLTMSGLSVPLSKVYDATTLALVNGSATLAAQESAGSGTSSDGRSYSGDMVSIVGTAVGTYNDKDVLDATSVSFSGLSLGGAQAGNYSLSVQSPVSATITPRALSASVSAPDKIYDGSTAATPTLSITAGLVGSEVVTASGAASFNSKDVLTANLVTVDNTALADGSGLASNYSLAAGQSVAASITPRALSASVSAPDKIYDGSTAATPTLSITAGLVGSEVVTASGAASFNSKDVLTANLVTVDNTALADGSGLASNYSLAAGQSVAASITVRPLSTWIALASGQWSSAGNWDALPDSANVLAVDIPDGATVVYDALVGSTQLQSITSAGTLIMAGGNLSVAASLTTSQYSQTGGALSGAGSFNANGSFSQSGGTIDMGGAVTVTQSAGNLAVGRISGASIQLTVPGGAITQTGALTTAGLLDAQSSSGSLFDDAGNRVSAFKAAASAAGNIALTNTGVLDVRGITTASGNITLNNIGGISTSGMVQALNGTLAITVNSPLTIGLSGVLASGDITLAATNLTSAGDMTLDGPVISTAGSINLSAANNLVQNGLVSAAGSVTANAGGSMTFGPGATTVGYPILYSVGGTPVAPPFNPVLAAQRLAIETVIGVMGFSIEFDQILRRLVFEDELLVNEIAANVANEITDATLAGAAPKQDKFILVLEGSICTP